jgi:hypothetical protein
VALYRAKEGGRNRVVADVAGVPFMQPPAALGLADSG